jgi:glutamate 5-kinase
MTDPVRQEIIALAHTVVVKVGTNVLADATGRLDRQQVQQVVEQLLRIRQKGKKVALVSSGAIGAGVGRLGLAHRPTDLRQLQACAAVGQNAMMALYEELLACHGVHAAQILLTASDFDNRSRYLNVRNTLHALFEWDCLPIINENDTVSVAEIKFGDNDHLAAMVTNLLQAPLLIILTTVEGLYSSDPKTDPDAHLIPTVSSIDAEIAAMAGASRSSLGTGGMRSKLRAARLVTAAGESVIMANGSRAGVLDRIMAAEPVGTLFLPHGAALPAYKRWLGYTARPKGKLLLDAGAEKAVREKGRSLLPVGVLAVVGTFGKGDVVALCNANGIEFARGLSNYSSIDADRIRGLTTERIVEVLGTLPYVELVHRDNLALLE